MADNGLCSAETPTSSLASRSFFYLFHAPLKETAAGEGVTLFGLLMTSDLAVFQTILHRFFQQCNIPVQIGAQFSPGDQPLGGPLDVNAKLCRR